MDRNIKLMKKALEVDGKRKKSASNKKVIEWLLDENITLFELSVLQYNKNVTRMSRESTNKRCMLFPVYKLNTLITFVNKSGSNAAFTVKWFEGKNQIEAGIASVHIFSDPDNDEITFTTLYSVAVNGNLNKSPKVSKVKFTFDNAEVVKIGKNTTREESFKSVGYVLLENLCEYFNNCETINNYIKTFEQYFEEYSEIEENNEIESFNINNIVSLLSSKEEITDDELLASKYL